jgi:hypothetical protein
LSGGAFTSACPSSPPEPATKLTTPFGRPASCNASTSRQALSGAAEAGFRTTVLPQISAGASFQAGMALGKFQGVTRPTTPIGLRMANMCTRSRSEGTSRPCSRDPFAAEIAKDVDGAADFAFGLRERLAFLTSHVGGNCVEAPVQDFCGFVEDGAAGRSIQIRPGGQSGGGSSGSIRHVAGGALHEQTDDFVRIRRVAVFKMRAAIGPLAIDIISENRSVHHV